MAFFDTAPLNVPPLAVLASDAGIVHLYSDVALKVLLETEIAHRQTTSANPSPASVPVPSPACDVDVGNALLLDGFAIAEWACYAKKKNAIATAVCRLNGELKRQLLAAACDSFPHSNYAAQDGQAPEDKLFIEDPWMVAQTLRSALLPPPVDLWADWKPTLPVDSEFVAPVRAERIRALPIDGQLGEQLDRNGDEPQEYDDKHGKDGEEDMTEQWLEDMTAAILRMAVSMATKKDLNDLAKELKASNEVENMKKKDDEDDQRRRETPLLSTSPLRIMRTETARNISTRGR